MAGECDITAARPNPSGPIARRAQVFSQSVISVLHVTRARQAELRDAAKGMRKKIFHDRNDAFAISAI
ncbi:hypothetical protein AA23498_2203 [Acetobacter nitrogenifigens DSM 23921 = NBRC 105050]|nr:hypothetical protein AA23498_2203 [Acetobacter nitrogenifigens DSM 23921 = NBRC 105050]